MDWSLDFSHHINSCVPDPLYQDASRPLPGSSEAFSFPDSDSVTNAEQTTDRLLQLQGRLHRILWAADREPAADLVEESLEIIKTFLEILQAAVATQGRLPTDCGVALATTTMTTGWPAGNSNETATECTAVGGPLKQQAAVPTVNYITAQQALTCYSYMLLMLDRVISVLTSIDYGSATCRVEGESSPAALSLGFFNLASQPALNVEVVLHLVLRMVQRLRVLIQVLVSGCKDFADRSSTSPTSIVVEGLREKGTPAATSIAVASHAVADHVSERERLLVERLSCLTSGL